jgi:hypothetical protein
MMTKTYKQYFFILHSSTDMTSIDKTGAPEEILAKKVFIGIGTVYVRVTFQAVCFGPDSPVSGLMFGHEVTVKTQSSDWLFQKPRVGRTMGIVAICTSLFFCGIIVDRPVFIRKRTLIFGMTGETFRIYI